MKITKIEKQEAKKEPTFAEKIDRMTEGHEDELLRRIKIIEYGEDDYKVWIDRMADNLESEGYSIEDLHIQIDHSVRILGMHSVEISTRAKITAEDEYGQIEDQTYDRQKYSASIDKTKGYNENLHGLIDQIEVLGIHADDAGQDAEDKLKELQQDRQAEWDRATEAIDQKENELPPFRMVRDNANQITEQMTAKDWLKT